MIESLIFDGANVVTKNLIATIGGSFVWDVELSDPFGSVVDMSATSPASWSATFVVCPDFGKDATITKTPTITNAALGQVETVVPTTDLATLTTGFYIYEFKVTDNNSATYTVARGIFYVNNGV